MVLFFGVGLLVSIVGLVALFMIKRWELQTGNMVFATTRPRIGAWAHATLLWIERVLPALTMHYSKHAGKTAERLLHHGAAQALLAVEHGLERVLNTLRGVTEQPRSDKEASAFLREVAEHKRKLLRTPAERRAVIEKFQ